MCGSVSLSFHYVNIWFDKHDSDDDDFDDGSGCVYHIVLCMRNMISNGHSFVSNINSAFFSLCFLAFSLNIHISDDCFPISF